MDPYTRAIRTLENSNARYAIVGGFSVVMHGSNRFTPDINVIIDFENLNLDSFVIELEANSFEKASSNSKEIIQNKELREKLWSEGKCFLSFQDSLTPNFTLEILLKSPIEFENLYKSVCVFDIGKTNAKVCSLEHLIEMKKDLNRAQDNMDIQSLLIAKEVKELSQDKVFELMEAKTNSFEKEQLDVLYDFSKQSYAEKLDWLISMLTQLGQFCFVNNKR